MKKILLGALSLIAAGNLIAQIEIRQDGIGPDLAGTTVTVNLNSSMIFPFEANYIVTNNTGTDKTLRITRVIVSEPTGWDDDLCWPPNCYLATPNPYTTPITDAPICLDGTSEAIIFAGTPQQDTVEADLHPKVSPDVSTNGTALYMYYIIDEGGNYIDSLGLEFNFTLGVNEIEEEVSVQIAPNPATNYISVLTKGISKGSIKLVDVLGNVVYKDVISGTTKKIDVSEFGNGVYFVIIESPGEKTINRKLIVRH